MARGKGEEEVDDDADDEDDEAARKVGRSIPVSKFVGRSYFAMRGNLGWE